MFAICWNNNNHQEEVEFLNSLRNENYLKSRYYLDLIGSSENFIFEHDSELTDNKINSISAYSP